MHAACVGAQAGHWSEDNAVREGHVADLDRLEQLARLRVRGGLRRFAHIVPGLLNLEVDGDTGSIGRCRLYATRNSENDPWETQHKRRKHDGEV